MIYESFSMFSSMEKVLVFDKAIVEPSGILLSLSIVQGATNFRVSLCSILGKMIR